MSILVTGATGGVGGELLRQLAAAGERPRALARDPARARVPAGVTVVRGDLGDPGSLATALEGVKQVFLYAHGEDAPALARAFGAAGVEHVVFLSTIDALNLRGYAQFNRRRHLGFEEALAAQGFAHTFLRPGAFASNTARFWGRSIAARGAVSLPFPEAQQAPIHPGDIAAVAARALTTRTLDGAEIVLTGPESLSQREQIGVIARGLGREIAVEPISVEAARAAMLGAHVPPPYVELLLAQWADEAHEVAEVNNQVLRATGRPARPLAAWVEEHREAFAASAT